jgi:hypothetical protein
VSVARLLTQLGVLGQAANVPAVTPRFVGALPEKEKSVFFAIAIVRVGVEAGETRGWAIDALTSTNQHNPSNTSTTKQRAAVLAIDLTLQHLLYLHYFT